MKVKALADVYQDEIMTVEAGSSLTVDYVDNFKGYVGLVDSKGKTVTVSIPVFANFFK